MSEYPPAWRSYRIKMLRKSKGLTLAELGKKVNLAPNTISQYENGKRRPSDKAIKKLAEYFDVSNQYLLGLENSPKHIKTDDEVITDILNNTVFSDDQEKNKKIKDGLQTCFNSLIDEIDDLNYRVHNLENPDEYDPYG